MNGREAGAMEQQRSIPVESHGWPLSFSETRFFRLACSIFAFFSSIKVRRRERQLHLCETLPLGEKRLLALVEVDKQRFLIGATNQSIALLHSFEAPANAPSSQTSATAARFPEETR